MPKTDFVVDYEPLHGKRLPSASEEFEVNGLPAWEKERRNVDAERSSPRSDASDLPFAANGRSRLNRGHAISYYGLLIFTLVLYFRPQQYFPALSTVPIALIVALLMLVAFIPSQLALEGTLTTRPREINLLLLLCIAALLSVPFAISPENSIHTFWEPFLKTAIVFIVIVNAVRTERRLKTMFFVALGVTCVLCFAALNDYRLGNLAVEGYRIKGAIAGGMFENTNDLGIHLVTMAPLAFMLGFATRNVLGKAFCWLTALVALAAMVVTFSRGAFIGLLATILVLSWKLARRRRGVVILGLIVGFLLFVTLVPGSYWMRLQSIFVPSLDKFGSSTARSEILGQSLLVALKRPLFGIGMGNFSLYSARGLVSHNSYTQVASEMGMAALLIYTMFITAPLNRLRKIEKETMTNSSASRFYFIAVGLQGSLVGYMVSSFFASVAYYWFIYYLVGYAICFRRIYESKTAELQIERKVEGNSSSRPPLSTREV